MKAAWNDIRNWASPAMKGLQHATTTHRKQHQVSSHNMILVVELSKIGNEAAISPQDLVALEMGRSKPHWYELWMR
jgi:hypothetical protein